MAVSDLLIKNFLTWKHFLVRSCGVCGRKMTSKVFLCILLAPRTFGKPLVATNKLSLATWGSYHEQDHMGPGTYAFGYDIEDPVTGNIQFKQEERHPNGTVTGNYGYVDADGRPHVVTYVSDEKGYRAKVEVEGQPTMYFPQESTLQDGQNNLENTPNPPQRQNLLIVPLQASFVQPGVPDDSRLDYPSFYNFVGVNAVSK